MFRCVGVLLRVLYDFTSIGVASVRTSCQDCSEGDCELVCLRGSEVLGMMLVGFCMISPVFIAST